MADTIPAHKNYLDSLFRNLGFLFVRTARLFFTVLFDQLKNRAGITPKKVFSSCEVVAPIIFNAVRQQFVV